MTFGELLDQYLKDADISAKELSRVSGISEAQLSRYRRGKRIPSLKSGVPEQLAESLTLLGGNRLPERQTLAAALAAGLAAPQAAVFAGEPDTVLEEDMYAGLDEGVYEEAEDSKIADAAPEEMPEENQTPEEVPEALPEETREEAADDE